VAYDGGPFSGWAPQPAARTVAGELLGALRAIDPKVLSVRGASRTDAGVHARGQIALFHPTRMIPPKGWALGLAAHLPPEIAVRSAARVTEGINPAVLGIGKRYRYLVLRDLLRDPFWEGRTWRLTHPLDLEAARAEAVALHGTHDFAAFRSSADERQDTVRTLHRIAIEPLAGDPRVLAIDVEGSAFMYNMVRIIVGTLMDVARERLRPGAVERALISRARDDLGVTAPAAGLYLEEVRHAIPVEEIWPEPS
jgi:tRNA pseudouridine38-40 synthase